MAYIGKAPDSLVTGQSTSEDIFTATANQTVFTLTSDVTKETDIVVAINGVLQSGTAYGMSGTGNRTLTFTAGLTVGDEVRVLHIGFKPTTTIFADGTVTTPKLADNSVTSAKIAVDVIVAEDIAANAITVSELQNNAVTTAKIIDDAVTTAKILDANVTTAKLAADAVDGTKLADNACNSEHYTDGSIDTAHIANAQITTALIADDAVTAAKIADAVALGGPSLGTNSIIRTNAKTISENISFAGNENGMTVGPITVANNYSVTVTDGSTWTIV